MHNNLPSWLEDQIKKEREYYHKAIDSSIRDTWSYLCWTEYCHFLNLTDEFAGTELDAKLVEELVQEAWTDGGTVTAITPYSLQLLGLWGEAAILHEHLLLRRHRALADIIQPINDWGLELGEW